MTKRRSDIPAYVFGSAKSSQTAHERRETDRKPSKLPTSFAELPDKFKRQPLVTSIEEIMPEVKEHTYPSGYPKDHPNWAVRRAWEMLDRLKPGYVPEDARAFLVGEIAGSLMKERSGK